MAIQVVPIIAAAAAAVAAKKAKEQEDARKKRAAAQAAKVQGGGNGKPGGQRSIKPKPKQTYSSRRRANAPPKPTYSSRRRAAGKSSQGPMAPIPPKGPTAPKAKPMPKRPSVLQRAAAAQKAQRRQTRTQMKNAALRVAKNPLAAKQSADSYAAASKPKPLPSRTAPSIAPRRKITGQTKRRNRQRRPRSPRI